MTQTDQPTPASYYAPPPSRPLLKIFLQYYVLNLVVAWCGVAILMVAVPRFEDIFRDFRTTLPAITQLVLELADLVNNHYGWIPLFSIACVWPALPALGYALSGKKTWPRQLLSLFMVLLYLGAAAYFALALLLPLIKLYVSVRGGS